MKKEISIEEYREARNLVDLYEKQQDSKKLSIYDGCTKDDIILSETKHIMHGTKEYHLWVCKGSLIPERNSDGHISDEETFFTNSVSRMTFETYDAAYNHLIKSFKRKNFIK